MLEKTLVPIACVGMSFALALCGCAAKTPTISPSASSSQPASSAASEEASESSASPEQVVNAKQFPAEYTNANGGVTFAAVLNLNGPDLEVLLAQQGYTWGKYNRWENAQTGDRLEITSANGTKLDMSAYDSATEPGALAQGEVSIRTHAYDLSDASQAKYDSICESIAPGLEIEASKAPQIASGMLYVLSDADGARYLMTLGVYDQTTLTLTFQTEEYAKSVGLGEAQGMFD